MIYSSSKSSWPGIVVCFAQTAAAGHDDRFRYARGVLKRCCADGKTPLPVRACAIAAGPATMRALPENPVKSPDLSPPPAHPARLILILSLAPTVGLGIGRFAYSLVLRETLGWSYSAAGFMNTINLRFSSREIVDGERSKAAAICRTELPLAESRAISHRSSRESCS
jgi:hypothetical protein